MAIVSVFAGAASSMSVRSCLLVVMEEQQRFSRALQEFVACIVVIDDIGSKQKLMPDDSGRDSI